MRGDRFDAELAEDERQDETAARIPVVDDDPEAAVADRRDGEVSEQVARVALPRPGRVGDRTDRAERHPPQLLAREVLLDLVLHRRRERDARALEEADLHR